MSLHALTQILCAPRGSSTHGGSSPEYEKARIRDELLVSRIREGDDSAFEVLFREYHESLTRFAHSYVSDPEAAEGIVSDVFLAVWERRINWTPERGAAAYLFGAVRNRALTHERTRRRSERWMNAAALEDEPPGI